MITTITPAPAIDLTIHLQKLEIGEVNRGTTQARELSGKGVNVSWAVHKAGFPTLAILPAGGASIKFVTDTFNAAKLPFEITETRSEMRTNVKLNIDSQGDTNINTSTDELSKAELENFLSSINSKMAASKIAVLAGSLPVNFPSDAQFAMLDSARRAGCYVALDTSGQALVSGLAAKPDLIKPNEDELAELTGNKISTLGDVVTEARKAIELGAKAVLVSLGKAGAMYVDSEQIHLAKANGITALNTVGAGDALLSGFVAGIYQGKAPEQALLTAVLWASSAVMHETTLFDVLPELESKIGIVSNIDFNQSI
jgi:1-phosphofructokinase